MKKLQSVLKVFGIRSYTFKICAQLILEGEEISQENDPCNV